MAQTANYRKIWEFQKAVITGFTQRCESTGEKWSLGFFVGPGGGGEQIARPPMTPKYYE